MITTESARVLDAFYSVYRELGYGFLESLYENAMMIALRDAGLSPIQQVPLRAWFRGHEIGEYRADIVISGRVLLEIKTASAPTPAHDAQLLNYLKVTRLRLGMLLNFGPQPIFRRRVN